MDRALSCAIQVSKIAAAVILSAVCLAIRADRAAAQQVSIGLSRSDLRQIDARFRAKYGKLSSVSEHVQGSINVVGPGDALNAMVDSNVKVGSGHQFLIENTVNYFDKDFRSTLISDGKTVWEIDPDAKRYTEIPLAALTTNAVRFSSWLSSHGTADLSVALYGFESLKEGPTPKGWSARKNVRFVRQRVDGHPCYVASMSGPGPEGGTATLQLVVDSGDLMLHHSRITVPISKKKTHGIPLTVDVKLDYDDITINDEFETGTFKPDLTDMEKVTRLKPLLERALSLESAD